MSTSGQTRDAEGRAQDIHVPLRSADMARVSVWPHWSSGAGGLWEAPEGRLRGSDPDCLELCPSGSPAPG